MLAGNRHSHAALSRDRALSDVRNAVLVSLIAHVLVLGLLMPGSDLSLTGGDIAQVTQVSLVGGSTRQGTTAATPRGAQSTGIAPVEALPPPETPDAGTDAPPAASIPASAAAAGAAAAPPAGPVHSPLDALRSDFIRALGNYLLSRPPPYPADARRRGAEGTTVVTFRLDGAGNVLTARVGHTSGDPALDAAAVDFLHDMSPLPRPPRTLDVTDIEWDMPITFRLQ